MATLKELSEITGYSIATISRVLNEDETLKVTDSTRRMIHEAAGKAEYSNKHSIARKSILGEHLRIGIVEMEQEQDAEHDPYYLYLKDNVEKSCFAKGMETVNMQYDPGELCYRSAVSQEVDGILAIGQFPEERIAAMERAAAQIIFLDASPCPERFCAVMPNFEVGVRQGIEYLMAQGHRRIAFVGPEFSTDSTSRQALELRRKFFCELMGRYQELEGSLIDTGWKDGIVSQQIIRYFKEGKVQKENPTAFFAYNEPTAFGILRALRILGYRVPEDFSILSYNDTVLASLIQPSLSGVRIHIDEMAEQAVELLEKTNRKELIPRCISVPSTLVVRESVSELSSDFK